MRIPSALALGVALLAGGLFFWRQQAGTAAKVASPALAASNGVTETVSPVLPQQAGEMPPPTPQVAAFAQDTVAMQAQAVLQLTNPLERRAAFEKLIASLKSLEELQGVLDAFATLQKTGRQYGAEWALFWQTIGHRDSKQAVALIEKNGSEQPWYFDAVNRVMEQWGALEPEAAVKWLNENEALNEDRLDAALASVIQGYANRDLRSATAYALSVVKPDEPLFRAIAGTLSRAAIQQGGTQGLTAWFDALPSDAHRQGAFSAVSNRLSEADMNQQREWLRLHADKSYRYDDAYRGYAQRLAEQNPRAAMDFVFGEAPRFNNGGYVGLGYASYEWLMQDPVGFTDYYRNIKDEVQRKALLQSLKDPLGDVNFPMRKRRAAEQFLSGLATP
ncbi:MAG: hypothetical protein V4599_02550 [Verrucomicrobiota bacterium]